MRDRTGDLEILRRRAAEIAAREHQDLDHILQQAAGPGLESVGGIESFGTAESSLQAFGEEAQLEAVIKWSRPVFRIMEDKVNSQYTIGADGDVDQALLDQLEMGKSALEAAIPSIGRIEVLNNGDFEWAGTGWIVDFDGEADVIITNAHVAQVFARQSRADWVFRAGFPDNTRLQGARIDFREELGPTAPREFDITDVIWIAPGRKPDVAFLRAVRTSGGDRLTGPIILAGETVEDALVATIGYPANDSRRYDTERYERLFGTDFGIKRLAPGRRTGEGIWGLEHDCSTLPGNSGSVLWDITNGNAAGLHYSGAMFRSNYAVPSSEIIQIIRDRPWQSQPETLIGATPLPAKRPIQGSSAAGLSFGFNSDGSTTLRVPDGMTVHLERAGSGKPASSPEARDPVDVVRESLSAALSSGDVLAVEKGFIFREGLLSDDEGIIVSVRPGKSTALGAYDLPESVGDLPLVLETGDPSLVAETVFGIEVEARGKRRAAYSRDLSKKAFALDPVCGVMKAVFHVSPEAGWPVLRSFLEEDRYEQLTIGMYHMTAPHVIDALLTFAERRRPNPRMTLTLDRSRGHLDENPDDTSGKTKIDDIPERETLTALSDLLNTRFKWAKASIGSGGLFATNYHIKVAVWSDRLRGRRVEDKSVWLSSGNWQSSNLPPLPHSPEEIGEVTWDQVADYNREWHALIEDATIAKAFRVHLEQDYADSLEASAAESVVGADEPMVLIEDIETERPRRPVSFKAFEPLSLHEEMTVQPLLTPDNYPEVVLDLINGARERLLIENQSFNLWTRPDSMPEHFRFILDAILKKEREGLDVRILFRSGFGAERTRLRRMKAYGFKVGPDHVRFFDKCHTKGFVIDDEISVLGSQNLTASGTGPNRDASLVVWNRKVNAYFAELFEYDWQQVAKGRVEEETVRAARVQTTGRTNEAPEGYRLISLSEYLGET